MTDATELDEAAVRAELDREPTTPTSAADWASVAGSRRAAGLLLLAALDDLRAQVERLHFDLDREARARQAAEQERDELSRAAMSTENGAAMLQHYVAKAQAAERERGHVVHVTVEPVAEDAVWCDQCEEWVTSGAPAALATPTTTEEPS